ncbi:MULTISPECIES: phosphate ABC transporter permease PstA [Burkholderia cepacia complex]|jgi:phosphate transport system permease protein|uniref:Phosphate transport system permease protein PstA n=1 Tax=Burkholderia cenocepacia TaxID=95486 RepID=A0ABD4UGT8_9BURK|nr:MULTISPECIES: phosphate ABC transporter permease PstA [Burkholderia cepacia complex]MCW3696760.1 phosphate ABC transporter permease PstA [Burkholderia cenocepacia]MCW3704976.1 phosphate ABC transporter permease PstA [Burkholderia cenocepacia]MCW3713236.1 phosphate ABC transporter permease PstA [Burkholderia cenocepacia]MCW3721827.1 phosphate ABC transporter permease PstA [Burkholderia cenocepacia]MCW3729228.1 phosphate ABC transporter permease PstA [Burkholderia cenocepacia]
METFDMKKFRRRRMANNVVFVLSVLSTLFGLFWLFWILATTVIHGFSALGPSLFTQMTPPPGEQGGLLNALYGSFLMIGIAAVIGVPLGLMAGIYLAEYARSTRLGGIVRFVNDILLSAPSIVIGLFTYELIVRQVGHFSGWAGAVALAIIMLPVVIRTTDEMLQLIPDSMREAALSLGIPRWKISSRILLKAASAGIVTGALLAVARISGETAPLLFTALNNQYWSSTPNGPLANIPVVIFQFAMSPYEAWHSLAWAGAFLMTVFVLALAILSRTFFNRAHASR